MVKVAPLLIAFVFAASLAGAHLMLRVHEQSQQLAQLNARLSAGVPCMPGGVMRLLP
ncbi:hypothetical protein SAMN05216577_1418 [Pseudomonas citronellolis]|jgi:hypothetical protein|uniref:Uncharacterized protein n=2 Tax=Pseudomonas TaxID=286 RepID=A0AAQ1KMN1_9PSED|nr:hypothetical protein [Pseudomonas citronellolis]UXJ55092.1 hypothetical protein N5P21_13095 [Pseudomonas citronellolis]GBL58411.1 hypothetical protein PCLA_10r0225 [Pseudomonas citronellolis]SFD84569.1 hypothetical protein SAMN05216577_1418 [Pseudomonas citronellolis]